MISSNDMGKACGCTGQVIRRFLKENGLIVPAEVSQKFRSAKQRGKTSFTKKEDRFIKANYLTMPVKTMASALNRSHTGVQYALRRLGLTIPRELIEARKQASRIQPGASPPNKGKKQIDYMSAEAIERTALTRFKKGDIPATAFDKDGIITIRHDHPDRANGGRAYKYVRLSLGVWKPLHTHTWEQVNGPLPEGHCLWFRDLDSMNCDLSNLELITRQENMARNTIQRFPPELISTIKILSKLKKTIKNHGTK